MTERELTAVHPRWARVISVCVTLTADNLSQLVVAHAGIMATNFRIEIIGTDSRTEQNTTLDKNTVLENLLQVLKDKFELKTIGQGTKLPNLCELLLYSRKLVLFPVPLELFTSFSLL